MKKLLSFLAVFGLLTFGVSNLVAQEPEVEDSVSTEEVDSLAVAEAATEDVAIDEEAAAEGKTLHKEVKRLFIEGGEIGRAHV